jgi:hypothetical protein
MVGGDSHTLNQRHGFSHRKRPGAWSIEVAADGPRSLVVMRMRWQVAIGQIDAPTIAACFVRPGAI